MHIGVWYKLIYTYTCTYIHVCVYLQFLKKFRTYKIHSTKLNEKCLVNISRKINYVKSRSDFGVSFGNVNDLLIFLYLYLMFKQDYFTFYIVILLLS